MKCACLDQRVFHERLVETRDAKGDKVVGKQGSSHGLDSGELFRSLSRKFKNVTAANLNSRQLTEVNEALERKECFFDLDQPLSDFIDVGLLVQCALRLPGHESVLGIVTQKERTGHTLRNRARGFCTG